MKQTNNAITFLMAHYRSIFKHAYVKGITTAAILTAGLATFSANAATNLTDLTVIKDGKEHIVYGNGANKTGTNEYDQLNVTLTNSATGDLNVPLNGTLKIVGGEKLFTKPGSLATGKANANTIKFSTETNKTSISVGDKSKFNLEVNITGEKPLTKGLSLVTDGKAVAGTSTLLVNDFNVVKGGVDVAIDKDNVSGSLVIDANTISIGEKSQKEITGPSAALYLGINDNGTTYAAINDKAKIEVGTSETKVTLNDTGAIYFLAPSTSGAQIVLNGKLDGQGGLLDFSSGSGTIKAISQYEDQTFDKGNEPGTNLKVNVGVGQKANITLAPSTNKRGILHFGQGSVVDLDQASATSGGGMLNIESGSADFGSIVKFDAGSVITVSATSGVVNTNSGAHIAIKGATNDTANKYSELHIDSGVLGSFLMSDVVTSGGSSDVAGSVFINGTTKTFITDDRLVNIVGGTGSAGINDTTKALDLVVSGSGSAPAEEKAGSIFINGTNNELHAKNLQVSGKIEGLDGRTKTLNLHATDLTLGGNNYTANDGLGFTEAFAKNVSFVAKDKDFALLDKVTLSSTHTVEDTINKKDLVYSDEGSINGNVTVSGTAGILNIKGGVYSADKITVSGGGNVNVVDNVANKVKDFESNLTINDLVVSGSTSSTVSASGSDSILTINSITNVDGTSKASIEAQSGANVYLNADAVQGVLTNAFDKGNDDLKIKGNSGTVHVDGNLELKANATNTKALTSLDFTNNGTLKVSALALNFDNVTDQSFKFKGNLDTQELSIATKGEAGAQIEDFTLGSGTYTVHSSLSSDSKNLIVNGAAAQTDVATLNLGQITASNELNFDTYYIPSTKSGLIDVDTLTVGSFGSVNVYAGDWASRNIVVSGGKVVVGHADNLTDINDEVIGASLTGNKLHVNTGSFKIEEAGTANFNGLNAESANAIYISGELKVKGGLVTEEDTSNEVKLAQNSVHVNKHANLIFGSDALSNSIMSGNVLNTKNIAKDAISIDHNGMVTLDFTSGSFSVEELTQLKKDLFSNDTNGAINGVLNIGKASIGDLKFEQNGNITWANLKQVKDVSSDVTNEKLLNAKVTGVDSAFKSHVGSIESTTNRVSIDGNASLNNAQGNNNFYASYNNAAADVSITNESDLALRNGGKIGNVALSNASSLTTGGTGTTTITSLSGIGTATAFNVGADTVVEKDVSVGELYSNQDGKLLINGTLKVNGSDAVLLGTTEVKGDAYFAGDLEVGNKALFAGDLNAKEYASFAGDTEIKGDANFASGVEVSDGAHLIANNIDLYNTVINKSYRQVLSVGEDKYIEHGETKNGSTGYLSANKVSLNHNTLIVDPDYGHKTAIAAIKQFGDTNESIIKHAGVADGNLIVGQNAALFIGKDVSLESAQAFLQPYQDSNGSLQADEVGSVLYIGDKLNLAKGNQIILDSKHSKNQILGSRDFDYKATLSDGKTYYGNYQSGSATIPADLYLGANTVLVVGDNTIDQGGAIHFESTDAGILAADDTTKIVLDGDRFLGSRDVVLFTDNGGESSGVKILGSQDIRVETLNGLMYFMLKHGNELSGGRLGLDISKVKTAYLGASEPVRDYLIAYASRTNNWYDFYNQSTEAGQEGYIERDYLIDDVADKSLVSLDANNQLVLSAEAKKQGLSASDFVVLTEGENTTIYRLAHNDFLEKVIRNTDGAAADQAARIGVLGGAAQAALGASSNTVNAINARYGIGGGINVSQANNGQGTSLWLTPLYKSVDASGFKAQGATYGSDLDIYGLALGADYTLNSGVSFGAMFNVGSGDVDGKDLGSNVKNDFNYYGVGAYAAYTMNQFSVVGDISYNVVDSDIDANTQVDVVKTSFDTKALSAGVTAQYTFDLGGLSVAPHAALRFTNIDMDNYDFSANNTKIGSYSAESASVFSIPVGITFAKEFQGEYWTVKPSLDLTVSGNFGDDELEGVASFEGVSRDIATRAEFIDNFTYGASAALSFQSQSTTIGLGINYTGSSNTDEFGVSANARFVF